MTAHARHVTARTHVQQAAMLVGSVFLLVGILGFIPGITTSYSAMEFASHESGAKLLGADDWLHFLLGTAMIGLALLLGRRTRHADDR